MNKDRLEYARWVLERNLHWIAVVETKTAIIISIDTAMLGTLAVAFGALAADQRTACLSLLSLLAALPIAASIVYGALAVRPQTKGPPTSFIFFGKIKNWSAAKYRSEFLTASDEALLDDCLAQIHRNAEIACHKYKSVTTSMKLGFASIPPWLLALGMLISARG